jgi:hypothetical protein
VTFVPVPAAPYVMLNVPPEMQPEGRVTVITWPAAPIVGVPPQVPLATVVKAGFAEFVVCGAVQPVGAVSVTIESFANGFALVFVNVKTKVWFEELAAAALGLTVIVPSPLEAFVCVT